MTLTDRATALAGRLEPTALGAVGLLATIAAFALTAGPLGAAVGVGLALVGLLAPPVAVFALGQAAILALFATPTLPQLALLEGALVVVLVGPATRGPTLRLLASCALLLAALPAATWYGVQRVGLQQTAVGLVLGVAAVAYLVHRYERVVTGLAGGAAQ